MVNVGSAAEPTWESEGQVSDADGREFRLTQLEEDVAEQGRLAHTAIADQQRVDAISAVRRDDTLLATLDEEGGIDWVVE